jgi:acetolactate synthase-1/2/3 large subunit
MKVFVGKPFYATKKISEGPDNLDAIYPDFVKISEGFGVKARRVSKREELRDAIQEMIAHDGPYVLEVIVPYTEHVLPMIKQGLSAKEILLKSPNSK